MWGFHQAMAVHSQGGAARQGGDWYCLGCMLSLYDTLKRSVAGRNVIREAGNLWVGQSIHKLNLWEYTTIACGSSNSLQNSLFQCTKDST